MTLRYDIFIRELDLKSKALRQFLIDKGAYKDEQKRYEFKLISNAERR